MADFLKQRGLRQFFYKLSYFGIDKNLPNLEIRKYWLSNVVVLLATFFLLVFAIFNLIIGNKTLAIFDIVTIFLISVPYYILQYKKCYDLNKVLVVFAFIIGVIVVAFFKFDIDRQSEFLLLGGSIIPVYLFDKWKKNLLFLLFPITFFCYNFLFRFFRIWKNSFSSQTPNIANLFFNYFCIVIAF